MEDYKCKDCKFFRQHFRPCPDGTVYLPVGCGHCVYPRLKHRDPNTEACFRFVQRKTEDK